MTGTLAVTEKLLKGPEKGKACIYLCSKWKKTSQFAKTDLCQLHSVLQSEGTQNNDRDTWDGVTPPQGWGHCPR